MVSCPRGLRRSAQRNLSWHRTRICLGSPLSFHRIYALKLAISRTDQRSHVHDGGTAQQDYHSLGGIYFCAAKGVFLVPSIPQDSMNARSVIIDNADTQIQYSSSWEANGSPNEYKRTTSNTAIKGESFTLKFVGKPFGVNTYVTPVR